MNEKKSRRLIYTQLENNLEIARTSRDTGKTPLINYVIGSNKKKEKIFEEKQESLECARKPGHLDSHCDVRKARELQIYLKIRNKKGLFLKTALQVRATNSSDLQTK